MHVCCWGGGGRGGGGHCLWRALNSSLPSAADLGNFSHFVDCLQTHHCHGLSWPKGMTEDLYDACFAELSWQMYSLYKYPSVAEMAVVGIGFLLKEIWTVSGRQHGNLK